MNWSQELVFTLTRYCQIIMYIDTSICAWAEFIFFCVWSPVWLTVDLKWNAVNICQAKWNPFSKYKPSSAASGRLRCLLINLPLFDPVVLHLHNNWLGSAQNQDINVRVEALNFCYFARDSFLVPHFWRISPSVSQSFPVLHYRMCVFMCSLLFPAHTSWHYAPTLVVMRVNIRLYSLLLLLLFILNIQSHPLWSSGWQNHQHFPWFPQDPNISAAHVHMQQIRLL